MLKLAAPAMVAMALAIPRAQAQTPNCSEVAGVVEDSTGALIPGAAVSLDGRVVRRAAADGHFSFGCVVNGNHHVTVTAEGFASLGVELSARHANDLRLKLQPGEVSTTVEVDAGEQATVPSASSIGGAQTVEGKQLAELADDPDDLLRELQQMAAMSGGNPMNTTVAVNGFQDSAQLPPKSSIAYIRVNPDMFSAEYREPPFDGGRVEVYTKPGMSAYHGALFATNGSPWMNARDPLSVSRAALGKQRYGFEFSGPLLGRKDKTKDFALTLEHRSIDNFAVVDAVTVGANGSEANTIENVATPQRLWVGEARVDWQLTPKNTLLLSFDTKTNSLGNVGVGGTSLAETGYGEGTWDNIVRGVWITTISPHLMHEAHASVRWAGNSDVPNSTAPSITVSGAFTGGGSTYGAYQDHLLKFEVDDDAILTTKRNTLKFGTQFMAYREHDHATNGFNGSYVFGSLAAYEAAAPQSVTTVTGDPALRFASVTDAVYIQDDWKVGHGLQISAGARYFIVSNPLERNGMVPRLGVLYAPGKKPWWTLHGHFGLFSDGFDEQSSVEIAREDGVHRVTQIGYNPVYNAAAPGTGNVFAGTTPIATYRTYNPHFDLGTWSATDVSGSFQLHGGWGLSWDLIQARLWNQGITENVNTPTNGDPYGPRPLGANVNILQTTPDGQGHAYGEMLFVSQSKLKWLQGMVGMVHVNLIDNTNDSELDSPQSVYSKVGEYSQRGSDPGSGNNMNTPWMVFSNGSLTLPGKVQVTESLMAGGHGRFNITTGLDNNGDGNYNDRPEYATPGQAGATQTPWGWMIDSGGFRAITRNVGRMPWTYHLDMNVQRAFSLTKNAKAEHPQTVTVNLRSSNLLNHTNVTQVGGVLGSPLFNVPDQADNGRRVEAGVRYSF